MSKSKLTTKTAAVDPANAGKFFAGLLWNILRSPFKTKRENSSLRLTRDGGMELDMVHFLQREDVQQRIKSAHELSIALGLVEDDRDDRKKPAKKTRAKKTRAKKPAKQRARVAVR